MCIFTDTQTHTCIRPSHLYSYPSSSSSSSSIIVSSVLIPNFGTMKCFSVIQKPKRRPPPHGGETLQSDLTPPTGNMNETDQFLPLPNPGNLTCNLILPSARPPPRSFRSRVRAIQNAQSFIRNTRSSGNPSKLLRSSTHGDTMFNSYGIKDNHVISSTNAPMPLPSPPSAYRLPLPSEHVVHPDVDSMPDNVDH